jgi:hypothetical protein
MISDEPDCECVDVDCIGHLHRNHHQNSIRVEEGLHMNLGLDEGSRQGSCVVVSAKTIGSPD